MWYPTPLGDGMSGEAARIAPVATTTRRRMLLRGPRKAARNQGTELRIHNKDGRIAKSDSHGNDPFPPSRLTTAGHK